MKTAAGIAALAALGLVAVNYSNEETTSLFLQQQLEEDELTFLSYITEFGKNYPTKEEYKMRLAVFKKNLHTISTHDEVTTGISLGLNAFSDYTDHEW